MGCKTYKLRSLTVNNGQERFINLVMEFEGGRAFVVWDSISLGEFLLKARVEIDPKLLQSDTGAGWDFLYRGDLVLPRPELN
jgi:hypothetical protein